MTKNEKWVFDYINGVDINNVKWIKLNSSELEVFFQKNYFDDNSYEYVSDEGNKFQPNVPLGLHYLSYDFNNNYSFLLGIVNNKIGKKTIVANIMFLENEFLFQKQKNPITYISSIEVNAYFQNRGIYKKMCEIFINFIDHDQHVVVSKESKMGEKCKVFDTLKASLLKNGFQKQILADNCLYNSKLYNALCEEHYILKKCKNK